MSEPFLERLTRFTPDAGTLDRDGLLFAAGRASVRPNRGWMCLSAVLAATQLLALALLWPQAGGAAHDRAGYLVQATPQRSAEPPESSAIAGVWSIRQEPNEIQLDERLASDLKAVQLVLVESEPVLRAFGPLPASVVN